MSQLKFLALVALTTAVSSLANSASAAPLFPCTLKYTFDQVGNSIRLKKQSFHQHSENLSCEQLRVPFHKYAGEIYSTCTDLRNDTGSESCYVTIHNFSGYSTYSSAPPSTYTPGKSDPVKGHEDDERDEREQGAHAQISAAQSVGTLTIQQSNER